MTAATTDQRCRPTEPELARTLELHGAWVRAEGRWRAGLRGAHLRGASLRWLLHPVRATRCDGYGYFAWTSALGVCVITASCREWSGPNAFADAREHCRTETHPHHRAEALAMVDDLERGPALRRERAGLAQ